MKEKLVKKIMKNFVELKTYSYLIDDNNKNKKSKRHKKVRHEKKT